MGSWFRGALRFRLLALAVAAGVLAVGIVQLRSAPVDVLPEFTPPYAEIQTEALGLSAEEVEQLITVPLEADLLNGVEGVDVIRSESVPGLSSIVLVFAAGTDVYRARQLVEERLTQAHALPNVSKPPTLLQPLSSSNRVLMIGLSSEKLSAIEQSVIARWTVRPRLMGVPGVANVSVWGMRDQQLQVQVDPARLRDQGVTLNQVIRSAGNAQVVSPLSFLEASTPGTGGFVETPQQRLQVRHLLEKIADPQELGKVPVTGTGGRLRLSDVANIQVDHQPLIGDAVVTGGAGLMLVVEKFPGASTLEVTEGVEDALETLRPGLSGMRTDTSVFRPASYISDALGNLGLAVLVGGLLMLLAMAALRFHWRAVLIAMVTVPLSLVVAGLLLRLLGQGFNAIAFAGIAAAVAVVVDEAVAPSDRVVRRLRQRGEKAGPASLASVVREASAEVRGPLMYATVILLLAIVPVAMLGGRPGAFFAPLALAYALAVAAAMLVALTVTPALTVVLFARWEPARMESGAPRHLKTRYAAGLQRFSRRRRVALVAAGACALLGLATLPFLQTSLVPTFKDRAVLVRLDGQPGTSNPRMTEVATEVSRQLQAVPGVGSVGAHVGRAVTGDRVTNVSSSDVWVNIEPDADYDATLAAINDTVQDVHGVQHEVVTYSTQKMRDVGALTRGGNRVATDGLDLLTGSDRPLAVRLFGQDPDVLRREASRVQEVMASVEGVVNPRVDLPAEQPTVEIEVDLDKAESFGITPGDVRRAEATLLQGIQVGSVFQQQKVFDVIVQGAPTTRRSVEDVRNLLIDRPGGGHLRLGQVADVRVAQTPAVIQRDAVSRRLDVEAEVSGRSLDAVAAQVESRLAEIGFPLEYHAEVLREGTAAEIGAGRVAGFAIAAAVAAFLLLQAAFRSWRQAVLVFATLPLALVGGLVAALLDGATLSLGSLLGLLAVFGLATRTSVLLVANLQSVERDGAEVPHAALVQRGAGEQLAPVLTSTAALALLVLPLAVLGPRPGLEVVHSMALVLLGGLISSAFVTLFLLPALYLHLASRPGRGEPDSGEVQPRRTDSELGVVAGGRWPSQRTGPVEVQQGETGR
jgi:Cu/Ag efflux pump CusA